MLRHKYCEHCRHTQPKGHKRITDEQWDKLRVGQWIKGRGGNGIVRKIIDVRRYIHPHTKRKRVGFITLRFYGWSGGKDVVYCRGDRSAFQKP